MNLISHSCSHQVLEYWPERNIKTLRAPRLFHEKKFVQASPVAYFALIKISIYPRKFDIQNIYAESRVTLPCFKSVLCYQFLSLPFALRALRLFFEFDPNSNCDHFLATIMSSSSIDHNSRSETQDQESLGSLKVQRSAVPDLSTVDAQTVQVQKQLSKITLRDHVAKLQSASAPELGRPQTPTGGKPPIFTTPSSRGSASAAQSDGHRDLKQVFS